jgi:hypothetical protein
MPLVNVIVILAVLGFIAWLVITYIPMPPIFKTVIIVVVVIVVCLWLLRLTGVGNLYIEPPRR